MKTIKMKQNCIKKDSVNYISDYLQTLGIAAEDVCSFIDTPRPTDEDEPFDLQGMAEAILLVADHCKNLNGKIFVQVDSDTDAPTSLIVEGTTFPPV